MAAIRASLKRDLDADLGDVVYFSNVMEPRHEFLTANNQTPYVFTCFDLRRGPMVLEVPPASDKVALFGSGIDSWEVPLVDVGPTGEDAGKGGRYLFLPPAHRAETPPGYFVVPSPTVFVHFALRPITIGHGTLADAVAYSQLLKTSSLAETGGLSTTRYIDAYPRAWRTLPPFDLGYLQLLADTIDADPPQAKDAVMLAMLASIGIEKGKAFKPDAEAARILTEGVQEGAAYVSYLHCDTDAGSGRQRAPPVLGTFRAPHDEVSAHELDTGRRKRRALRRSLADRETLASMMRGRPHFRRSAPRSSSSVGCQATSTSGER
jgi:hypothetical protein